MATLKESVNDTYDWSLSRIAELCNQGGLDEVMNGNSIRQEFNEWLSDNYRDQEIISLEYIGEGSKFDE
tara:strand:+ start:296 stop:502 length:207 start_codon:yes stop_codon:yes gene_type:complete